MSVAYDVPTPAGRPSRRSPAAVLLFPRRDDLGDVGGGADITALTEPACAPDVQLVVADRVVHAPGIAPEVSPSDRSFAPEDRAARVPAEVGLEPRALLGRRETGRVVAAVGLATVDPERVSAARRDAARPDAMRRCAATSAVADLALARPDRIADDASSGGVRLTVRGRRVVAVLCAVAFAVAGWITVGAVHGALAAPLVPSSAPAVVTVHPGDTLWSIASRLAPERDPRAVVAALRKRNHLASADVQAGEHLVVPR